MLLLGCSESWAAKKYFQGYAFEAEIVPAYYHHSESSECGGSWDGGVIKVSEGQEYSIVVRNPLPVRVAAAVTVDGLNTIDAQHTSPADGQKWLIEPYSSITVRGWQTSDSSSRRFFFTRAGYSYAKWKERRDRENYSANIGVIGVAYFWNSRELEEALYPPRRYYHAEPYVLREETEGRAANDELGNSARSQIFKQSERAGTGMGRSEWHRVKHLNFHFDAGMYDNSDVLKIRYEFGYPCAHARPFREPVEYRYRHEYAPEMP